MKRSWNGYILPMSYEKRLVELGIVLPEVAPSSGQYIQSVRTGQLLFLAGRGPNGPIGTIGREVTVGEGYQLARRTGLMLLAVIRRDVGSLDRVSRIVKVNGFLNATPDFRDHPKVMDGCSELLIQVFGERGRHVRTSVGVASLPYGIPIEIEAVIELA